MPEITRLSSHEQSVLRSLAERYAGYARLPVQEEKKRLWKALNHLKMIRPMVAIDQLPWHEMDIHHELELKVRDPFWQGVEKDLRQTLYKWVHLPADMVLDPVLAVPKAFANSGYGLRADEDVAILDQANDVKGHAYHNQLRTASDLEKLKTPIVRLDREETQKRQEEAHQLFDGILPVRMSGIITGFAMWDRLAEWMGPADILYALADEPEHLHAIMERFTAAALSMVDQLEEQGLLDAENNIIHCSYNYCDDLPGPGYDPDRTRAADCWTMGMAQIFSAVSPAMHEQFEIDYVQKIFARFRRVYYGCCEPLHDRIDKIRQLPNVRKISCSPWCDVAVAAGKIGGDYVLSKKPSPAFLATETVDWKAIEKDLRETRRICAGTGTPLEYILKDISTLNYQPQRLWDWNTLAMEVVTGG